MSARCRRPIVALALFLAGRAGAATPLAAEHLAAAIRFRTVSHQDHAQDERSEWRGLRKFLERTYPKLHRSLARELVNEDGLLYTWAGSDPSAKPILLMAHQDVVPVEPGTESAWTHPPFAGTIADGFVWGRGAMDDKASLVLLMEAVESLVTDGFRPRRTIYLASGFDEEVGGGRGAAAIAALLASRGVLLEWVLDEGRAVIEGVVPEVSLPVALIGVAEKGFVSVELTTEMEGGHSSMPPPETAVGVLAAAVDRLERHQMPARLRGAPRESLRMLAPYMPPRNRFMLSNLWLFGPLVTRALERRPVTNAWVRTTTAPTIFQSGVKENVLPSRARAVVNFRILQGDSVAGVLDHVRRVVDDERVTVAKLEGTVSEPSPESSTTSAGYRLIESTALALFPGAVASPSLVVGATDSRWFTPLADDVYRFAPMRVGPDDLKRFHGTNERFPVEQVGPGVEFYRRILHGSA
jgi:carboxypeptidase PM20D1